MAAERKTNACGCPPNVGRQQDSSYSSTPSHSHPYYLSILQVSCQAFSSTVATSSMSSSKLISRQRRPVASLSMCRRAVHHLQVFDRHVSICSLFLRNIDRLYFRDLRCRLVGQKCAHVVNLCLSILHFSHITTRYHHNMPSSTSKDSLPRQISLFYYRFNFITRRWS